MLPPLRLQIAMKKGPAEPLVTGLQPVETATRLKIGAIPGLCMIDRHGLQPTRDLGIATWALRMLPLDALCTQIFQQNDRLVAAGIARRIVTLGGIDRD